MSDSSLEVNIVGLDLATEMIQNARAELNKPQAWTRHDPEAVARRAKYGLEEGRLGR